MTWKVADFGLTTEGSSQSCSTRYKRGTPSYRAPELLKQSATFNNKVDIFAMGCILFELVSDGEKAFCGDIGVLDYAQSRSSIASLIGSRLSSSVRSIYFPDIRVMLSRVASQRPTAKFAQIRFSIHRAISVADLCKDTKEHNCAVNAYNFAIGKGAPKHLPEPWGMLYGG
jgi:serine/threonine protein kinase